MKNAVAILISVLLFFGMTCAGPAQEQGITLDPRCHELKSENTSLIRQLIHEIGNIEGKGDYYDITSVYPVLAHLNKSVMTANDIEAFRCLDSLETIRKLVAFARIEERTIRINASLLLANVVDNTTLCGVLEELLDRTLNDNARYNLWQVVLVVAVYARVENQRWSKETLADNRLFIANRPNYERTLQKMVEVEAALSRNNRIDSLLAGYTPEYNACLALPHIGKLGKAPPP